MGPLNPGNRRWGQKENFRNQRKSSSKNNTAQFSGGVRLCRESSLARRRPGVASAHAQRCGSQQCRRLYLSACLFFRKVSLMPPRWQRPRLLETKCFLVHCGWTRWLHPSRFCIWSNISVKQRLWWQYDGIMCLLMVGMDHVSAE